MPRQASTSDHQDKFFAAILGIIEKSQEIDLDEQGKEKGREGGPIMNGAHENVLITLTVYPQY